MKKAVIWIIILLAAVALGFFTGRWSKKEKVKEIEIVRVDTLTVWDTVRIDRPFPVKERVVETIYVPVTDTLTLRDTTFVLLPRTQKEYSDSLYRAWVSGYEPALDSIDVFNKTKYVTVHLREKPKKWHVGVTAGYGVSKEGLSPYAGVGVTYSIFSF